MSTKEKVYLASFQEISRAVSSTLTLDEILELIVNKVVEVMNLKGCTIRLINPRTNTMDLVASTGLSEKYLQKGRVDMSKSVTEALSGRPVFIHDATTDPRMQYPLEAKEEGIATLVAIPVVVKGQVIGVMRLLTSEPRDFLMDEVDFACGIASILSVPISLKGKVIGVLRFYTDTPREFTDDEISFATILAEQAALAMENARMFQKLKGEYEAVTSDLFRFIGYTRSL